MISDSPGAIAGRPLAQSPGSAPVSHSSRRDRLPGALRIALSSYAANGLGAALGLLSIAAFVHLLLGPDAAVTAAVGVIVATPPDQPAQRRGKFTNFLPVLLIGTPLFFATSLVRESALILMALLVSASFVAFLGTAWGKRGLPVAVSVTFAMLFALAVPPATSLQQAWQATLAFGLGAWLYALWGTFTNALLNARYRVLVLVDALNAVSDLMRTQGFHFTMSADAQRRTGLAGRQMKQQVILADQLQAARDILLESPTTTPRRRQLAGMLVQLLDMRDHLLACALDLDALRAMPGQHELLQVLGVEIQALAGDIEQLADALMLGRQPPACAYPRPALAALAAIEATPAGSDIDAPPSKMLAGALARRVGYLHEETARILELARGEREPDVEVVCSAWQLFVSPTNWTWQPLLSLWRRDAPPLRHAIRAALAIAAGYAAGVALPWGAHEYWILLTITVVLRGSLAQTLERRNGRVAGTLLGCLLGGLLLYQHVPPLLLLLVVAVAQGIAHAFALQRYLVAAVAATVLALGMAHMLHAGSSPAFEAAERVMDTLVGVAIAWVFSYLLPSWERTQVGALVLRALLAQAKYAGLSLGLEPPGTPGHASELAWRLARREAYDSLSALVQAVERSLAEPRAVRPPLEELQRMLGHSYQLLAQLAAIRTMLLQRRDLLDFGMLREPLEQAARAIDAALVTGGSYLAPRAQEDAMPVIGLELDNDSGPDLTPLLLRRLSLAVAAAQDVKADAARSVERGSRSVAAT